MAEKVGRRLAREGVIGRFVAPNGREKHYVASDHVESEAFRSLVSEDLFEIAMLRGLHFNQASQTGIVFHMLSSVAERGRFGLAAVGDSREEATEIYERAQRELLDEAARAGAA